MFKELKTPIILAMIQPEPCPGSYLNKGMKINEIIKIAKKEVAMLESMGFDGYIIQNRNDAPIKQTANIETVAYVSIIANELKREFSKLIQGILINWDGVASLAVADAVGSDFIRVEHTYTGCEVGYAGLLQAQCIDILSLKKKINSNIPVFADIQEIHYEQLCGKNIVDNAWDTIYNAFADGLFIGGKTAEESIEIIKKVRNKIGDKIPIMLSGGANDSNISNILKYYDGVSVGSWIKNGNMRNPIDEDKAKKFIQMAKNGK